jgi:ATP-binding cassette subfamily B protein
VPTGDVTSRVTNDVQRVRVFYALTFLHLVNTGVAYAIGIWRMSQVSLELTLYCLAPYPFLLAGILWLGRELFYQTKVVQAQLSDISSKVQENLDGMSVIKSFVLEDREKGQFESLNQDFFGKNLRLALIRGGLNALIGLVATVGTLMLLVVGTYQVIYGPLSLGQFVEFNGYVVQLAFPTIAMGWVFQIWYRGRAAFDRIVEILLREPELKDPPDDQRQTLPSVETHDDDGDGGRSAIGAVEFDGVSFGYDDETVLKDINLEIPAGSTVAFVGRTGSGKSTLVKLIGRLYDVDDGEVRLDGSSVDRVGLRDLRSEIGFVPQEPFLFSMTLRQNIRFGLDALEYDASVDRPVPTGPLIEPDDEHPSGPVDQEERIRQAIQVSGLKPDVDSFSDGLETLVGERGVTLSGGQKQRATLARAVLIDPRLLILDDALSSVDTQTEQVILDHLDYIMRDRTSIILTHRFNALDRVDKIYVMHEGRIVERGTHQDLLEAGGHYARMHRRQQLQADVEEASDDETDGTEW